MFIAVLLGLPLPSDNQRGHAGSDNHHHLHRILSWTPVLVQLLFLYFGLRNWLAMRDG